MIRVELSKVGKSFGDLDVVHDVDLAVGEGEFVVFVGPSGCGKSTLLRMICGLEHVTRGDVKIDGRPMNRVDPSKREVAMVFQSYALYPHMTVEQNMGFALRMEGVPVAKRAERVREAARILRLTELLGRLPKQLSGGQRQRVAIGRAIVRQPKVFLFDEPLSNLDAELRVKMRLELSALHRELGATMLYVTHDQVEAMTMADRIVVLRAGRIEQVGTPTELYARPDNLFVAGFMGSPRMNLLAATVRRVDGADVELAIEAGDVTVPVKVVPGTVIAGETVTLGVRPEHLTPGATGRCALTAEIGFIENLGGTSFLHAPGFPAGGLVAECRHTDAPPRTGPITLNFDPTLCHLFDAEGRRVSAVVPGR